MSSYLSNPEILNNLLEGRDLDELTSRSLMQRWLNDEISDVETGAFLSALRAKSSTGVELSSTPVVLLALKALKKAPVSTSEISSLSHLFIKDLEVNSSRFLPSNKLFRISAFDRLENIYLLKKIMQFNLRYQNLSQLNLY